MIECIEISLKSFESKLVKNVVSQIFTIFQKLPLPIAPNAAVWGGPFLPPTARERARNAMNRELAPTEQSVLYTMPKILNNPNEFFPWKCSHFSFPMTEKKFLVLRSPHIDKKSREQFKVQYFKDTVFLKPNRQVLDNHKLEEVSFFQLFAENLKRIKFHGVQVKIRIIYTTFLEK